MRTRDVDILIVPERQLLAEEHWQSRWANRLPTAQFIATAATGCDGAVWTSDIRTSLAGRQRPAVMVGHGLGAIAVVTALAGLTTDDVAGAYLVAPADIASVTNGRSNVFDEVPLLPLQVPSVVVASTNDPHCSIERARQFAAAWGSEITEAGDCGHLDDRSAHGPWPEGLLRFGVFLKALG